MNKTKIEWCDYSWNPITGCLHGCWYCYARKLAVRFKKIFPNGFNPTFYPERLREPYEVHKPARIFVCSIADLFASWTPREWTAEVLNSMLFCPTKHTFQMLTKNPERINLGEVRPIYPKNWWFGATVNVQDECDRIDALRQVDGNRFISFEPLLGNIEPDLHSIQWVIIGKLTGSRKVLLQKEWVNNILLECDRKNIPVFMKNNLVPTFSKEELRQEFPDDLVWVHQFKKQEEGIKFES